MDAFWQYFALWGPFGLGALAAGLLGYGLVAGLLLRGPGNRTIARPFHMSAFFMAVLTLIAALVEPHVGTWRGPFTFVVATLAVVYGFVLVALTRRRPLARVHAVTFVILQTFVMVLPLAVGLLGTLRHEAWLSDTVAPQLPAPERADVAARFAHSVWVPIEAGGVAALFLLASFLLLLHRRARELPRRSP